MDEKTLSYVEFCASPNIIKDIDEMFEMAIEYGLYDICDTTAGTFQNIQFLVYPSNLIIEFDGLTDTYYLQLGNCQYESFTLAELEDRLYKFYVEEYC